MKRKMTKNDIKYRSILVESIKRINQVSLNKICKRLDLLNTNIRVKNGMTTESLEKLFDEYVNNLLKEIILAQSELTYASKIYYGGRKNVDK